MGGPAGYAEGLGGYKHMLSKDRGLHITGEQRPRASSPLSRYGRSDGCLVLEVVKHEPWIRLTTA